MGRKAYNPYRLRTDEITQFRGIANAENEQTVSPAYVEEMDNLTSPREREMSPRKGQSRSTEYPSGIQAGRKTLKQVVTIEGSNLHSTPIRDNLTPAEGFDFIRDIVVPDNTEGTFLVIVADGATGVPVSGATVVVSLAGNTKGTGVTGAGGFATITGLDSNTLYTVTTTSDVYGFDTQTACPSPIAVSLSAPFAFTIETSTPSQVITLPLMEEDTSGIPITTYNFEVTWGDGDSSTITAWNDVDKAHTYTTAGTYQLTITGTCPMCSWGEAVIEGYVSESDAESVISVENLGVVGWIDLVGMFSLCTNLVSFNSGATDTSAVAQAWNFLGLCSSLVNVSLDLDLSNADDVSGFFGGDTSIVDLSGINIIFKETIDDAHSFFSGCTSLTTIKEGLFDGILITKFFGMFGLCTSLSNYDFSNWTFASNDAVFSLFGFLTNAGVDPSSYNSLLIALDTTDSGNSGLNLDADGVKYSSDGVTARASLVSKGWDITDGGLA